MAKGSRTTSTPRRATAAKATTSPKAIICRLEDQASEDAYGIGHLTRNLKWHAVAISTALGEIRYMAEQARMEGAA